MAKARRVSAAATPAVAALTRADIAFTVHRYPHDPSAPSYGLEAAQALGVDPARVLKTLLVDTGRGLAVGILRVDRRLDLRAVAGSLGVRKVTMAEPSVAERSTGYVLGGISPLAQRRSLPTVLDRDATSHLTVLVSGGRRGMDLELAPADLVRATAATVAQIAQIAQ